ncbi:MAG: hypothetical protein A2Y24_08715 [Clostridiales bacterium GWE2_32_10]|nr:MAG: hypothetical protein A2Y24_08715 [Clostridiales bacterium GWE2_32_10]HBY20930.1 YqeG family HAD IIIA-type phosphatase [Clostridiales bacterium]
MLKKLKPDIYVDDIYAIDYEALKHEGITGIIFDIDNTLIPYEESMPNDKIQELFDKLKEMEFVISFISNGPKKRVDKFNTRLNFYTRHRACKPLSVNLRKFIEEVNLEKNQVAIIGDQIFTDVIAGKCAGIKTILVRPIKPRNSIIEKIKRRLESKLLQKFNEMEMKR